MLDREAQIDRFLSNAGWQGADVSILAEDASFRRYKRIKQKGMSAVLMDAPPSKEDVRPFLKIGYKLAKLGLSVPKVYAKDLDTFSNLLNQGVSSEDLYTLAVDDLIELHERSSAAISLKDIPIYSKNMLIAEAALLVDWYFPAVMGTLPSASALVSYKEIWQENLQNLVSVPGCLVLRDFHVDNLILLRKRSGIQACGILDFQDAVSGPVTYDFISLIQDARRDVSNSLSKAMRARYLGAFSKIDPEAFDLSCATYAAQRHCKVLGIFTRLRDRDGKAKYLEHIPRLWGLLEQTLRHPVLAQLRDWFEEYIPQKQRIIPPPWLQQ